MESLMKPVTENGDTSATRSSRRSVDVSPSLDSVLDEIRAGAENALYGTGPDESEELFTKHIVSLIEGAGLPVLQTMHYRWFLRELARLWRTRQGRDLAFHLELCIRKWVGLGLETRTLQFLVCEAHERLKGRALDCGTVRQGLRANSRLSGPGGRTRKGGSLAAALHRASLPDTDSICEICGCPGPDLSSTDCTDWGRFLVFRPEPQSS
jgi:hypothetical protein